MLGRTDQEQPYLDKAAQLKSAFLPTFYNAKTGWLGWWRSRDGMLHDIYSDVPTSFAINYGVVDKDKGKEMLERIGVRCRKPDSTASILARP